jgi:uncharacterized protein with GYD domain
MLSTLTDEGRKTLKERPERLQAVNKELEEMGARVTYQFAVLGSYDFVNVIEAPSNEVMARISMELGSRGTIKIVTLPAVSIDEFVNMMTAAKT